MFTAIILQLHLTYAIKTKPICVYKAKIVTNHPISVVGQFIEKCEEVVGKKANYIQVGNQPGDVPRTYADIKKAKRDLDYCPNIGIKEGLRKTYEYLNRNSLSYSGKCGYG